MKTLIILSICVIYCAATGTQDPKCMWGPSYWCSNLKAAKSCGAVKHCILTVWTHDKPVRKNTQNDEICSYCQNLVADVRKFLTEKQTQEEIQKYLDRACSIIPEPSLQNTCKDMVNNYMPEILQLIESEMDPQAICAVLGLCTGYEDTIRHKLPAPTTVTEMYSKVGNTYCADCKKFFTDIQDIITSNQTQAQIEQLIDNFCPVLGKLKYLCKEVMDAYLPQVLQMVANDVNPAVTCALLGMCGRGDRTLLARMKYRTSPLYKALQQQVSNEEECLLCKAIVKDLQTAERENKTQVMIENFVLQKICPHLGPLSDECKKTVQDYGQELFEILANLLDPDMVCQALGFCSATPLHVHGSVKLVEGIQMEQAAHKPSVKASAPTECILCEFVMKELDGILKNNATQEEIEDALDKVCSYLPSTVSLYCQEFVNTFAKLIVELLVQEVSPKEVCTTLGLCSKGTSLKYTAHLKVKSSELCDTCKLVMQYVDSLLEQNSTVEQIEKLMEKICNYLPDEFKDQCDDIVKEYGRAIVQLIAQAADPSTICKYIGLCGNTSVAKDMKSSKLTPKLEELLGARKCTYGPSFWCASQENAKRCNAVPHCEKHVWKKNKKI